MKAILTLIFLSVFSIFVIAQDKVEKHWCGAHDVMTKQISDDPSFEGNLLLLDGADYGIWDNSSRKVTIPVVFHIVYKDSSEIPSMEDMQVQIEELNKDFNAENWDKVNVDDEFSKLIADTRISFKMATVGPDGKPTDAVTYTKTDEAYFTIWDDIKSPSTGGSKGWDSKKYLNIWVGEMDGVLGYAQFPGGNKVTDGVVIDYGYIGISETVIEVDEKTGDSTEKVIPNRVLTHEIGHWLGLYHIWGDEYCGDDKIKDTPQQYQPHWYCPDGPIYSCGSTDLTNNFMDYLGFECMLMFTKKQSKKMWKTLVMFRHEMLKKSNRKLTE